MTAGLAVAAIGFAGAGPRASAETVAAAAPTQTTVSTFSAEADSRVHEASPTSNFGSRVVLRVDGAIDPDIESYLRFTVTGISGSVQRATLRLHAVDTTVDGPKVSGTSNGWVESAITWSNRPPPTTAAVDDEGAIPLGSWMELDVTSLVTTNGTFSVVLAATHQDGVDFDSREATTASLRPELVVESLTSNAPVSTSPPTITGIPQDGQTLTAAPGTWNGTQPITFQYQWQRCDASGSGCADITDANGQSFSLTPADVGATFRVVVTATNVDGSASATSAPVGAVIGAGDVVVAAAGDIAYCGSTGHGATAALLDSIAPTRVLALGDLAYTNGTDAEFADCYDPSWGRFKAITNPSPGNHEYNTPGATGYYNYFGAAAGDPAKGYYAFDLGAWRIYALNSNCSVVPCGAGSEQEQWLRADLAAHPQSCLAAFMHFPRFSSGAVHGSIPVVSSLWNALYDYRADLVLAGHDHTYERFTRLHPTGTIDLERGIRSFVVGTGGRGLYAFGTPVTGSEARSMTLGVLKLILRDGGYDWEFVPVAGSSFTDRGSDTCAGAPADTVAPGPPADLVATTAQAGNVGLGWTGATDDVGVVAYDVYRDAQLLASTTTTTFTDTSAAGGSTYQYYVRARDSAGNPSGPSNSVTVAVGAANQAPSITSDGGGASASLSVPENSTAVTDVDATDADVGDTLTYAIGGTDAGRFAMAPSTGVLTFQTPPDFEVPADAGPNNVYDVIVSVSDGNGGSDSQAIAVAVQNVNEFDPVITSNGGGASASLSAAENQTAVTDVDATDGDGTAPAYAISGGVDGGTFTIATSTGVLTFTAPPDFEARGDANQDNVYEVTIEASDGTRSDTQALSVTVTDVLEGGNSPPTITSNGGGATAALSVAENQTAVTDVDATDPDPDTLTYALSGTDVLAFTIVPATGVLTFVTAPNFEFPSDAGLNNVYDIAVTVSDGNGGSDSQALAVTVTDVAEGTVSPLYFSLLTPQTVGGVSVDDEDVAFFDGTSFSLAFDGSDVGLAAFRIDAFSWVTATSLLLSFDTPGTVGGVAFDDSDIVLFTASSLGQATAGTLTLYFDGSDVGLTTNAEDVDAVELLPNNHLLVSTLNTATTTSVGGEDEDLLEFTPTSIGTNTAGAFALYFDGSDVGLTATGEDVDAAAVDATGKVYLSTLSNFSVTGISGADEDVFVFTPTSTGTNTAGNYSSTLYFDGSTHGLGGNDLFAIDLP